jgi:Putative Actinobacterial Holin-X, holin superfamily III
MTDTDTSTSKRSVFRLIGDLPNQLIGLVKAELESLKNEMVAKLKAAGIGIGLFAGAAFFAFFAFAVLITAAVLGIAVALPAWLSALIVAVALLIIAGILAFVGLKSVKKGVPPAPKKTIDSLHKDVNAIKGVGKRD